MDRLSRCSNTNVTHQQNLQIRNCFARSAVQNNASKPSPHASNVEVTESHFLSKHPLRLQNVLLRIRSSPQIMEMFKFDTAKIQNLQ